MNTIKLPLEHTTSINNCDMYYTTGAAYDTESTTIYNDDKTVKIAFVYHVQFAIGTSYYTFRTLNDFCIFLKQLVDYLHDVSNDENEPKLIIWVCNMSHEYAFIKNYLNDFNITKIFGKTRRQPLLIEIGNVIQFREAIGLWGHSAKDISDNWCEQYKKLTGDLDYELIRHSLTDIEKNDSGHSEYDYMKNDVLLLTEMHNHIFREYINENGSIYIPYTVSGLVRLHLKDAAINDESLTEFRERCFSKIDSNITVLKIMNKNIFTNSDDWNLLRTYGFSGGVVGTNRVHVGHVRQHVKCADIESDYPYQMLSKQYPCGKIHVGHEREWKNALNEHKPVFALIAIEKLTAKTEHAFISKHKIVNDNSEIYATRHGNSRNTLIYNGKIVQAENVLLVVNDVDYSIYSDAYDMKNVVCLKCWYFDRYGRLPVWLRKCVAMDYYTKTIIKRKYGKKAQTMISYRDAKSRVNTYFGTLALRPSDVFDSIDDSDYLLKPDHELTFDEMVKNTWLNPYWAFYITSYARKMLIENIIYRPNCVIQYDTDSIYYISNTNDGRELEKHLREFNDNCRHMNRRRLNGLVDDIEICENLGTWDFDDEYKQFLGMGAKKYIKSDNDGIHSTIAGLPKSAIPAEIFDKHIKQPFDYYNPIKLEHRVIIDNQYCKKLASVYCDDVNEKWIPVTDYRGMTILQPVSSYHALIPIDFTLDAQNLYFSKLKQFNKTKSLQ